MRIPAVDLDPLSVIGRYRVVDMRASGTTVGYCVRPARQ